MIPKNRIPTHPGEMLLEEFLRPLEISQTRFAEHIGVDPSKVSALVNAKMSVTPVMAWRLARALGTTPEFWMNLQMGYDLAKSRDEAPAVKTIRKVKKPSGATEETSRNSSPLTADELVALKRTIGQAQAFLDRVEKQIIKDGYAAVLRSDAKDHAELKTPNAWQALSDDVRRALDAYEREPKQKNAHPEKPIDRQHS